MESLLSNTPVFENVNAVVMALNQSKEKKKKKNISEWIQWVNN